MFRGTSFLIILLLATSISAQDRVLRFRHLMDRDDLSSNSVLSICQDYRGFMWFGTRDGLNRYDGYEFRTYYNDPDDSTSISANHVNVVFEDSQQNLWIGTSTGVNRFDREKDRFVRIELGRGIYSLSNEYIKSIKEDREGNIWVSTSSGFNIINPETGRIKHFLTVTDEENNEIRLNVESTTDDSRGNNWICSRTGLYMLIDDKITPYPLKSSGNTNEDIWTRELMEDKEGNLWIATERNGVFRLNYSTNEITNYRQEQGQNSIINNRVRTIFENPDGTIWFGTREGLSVFDPETGKFQNFENNKYNPSTISHNSVRDIAGDHEQGIWIATYAGGVNYYHANNNIFHHVKEEFGGTNTLAYSSISYLYKDRKNILWIGTEGKGLNAHDESQGGFRQFINSGSDEHIGLDNIKSISDADNGILWLGSVGGLIRFNIRTAEFINYFHDPADTNSLSFNQVHSTIIDSRGNLWVGTNGGGLDRYIPDINGFLHNMHSNDPSSLIHNNIDVLLEDSEGKIWIGTQAGLDCFDPDKNRFLKFPDIFGERRIMPRGSRILALFEDSRGRLWVGTEGKGLLLLNRHNYSFSSLTTKDGLPNNVVNAIIEDENSDLWISTNRGISRISYEESLGDEETEIIIRNFNESEGLQGLQFYPRCALKDKEGRIYFGGINGYNVFLPDEISYTSLTPSIVFTDFRNKFGSAKIGEEGSPLDKAISETREVTLEYSQREFSVSFAGLNYLNPENIYYSYTIEGSDGYWNNLGNQRTITFASLTAGDYELMVRASDDPNNWGEEYSSLMITVLPPPWRSWWAYLLYAMIGLGIFTGIMLYYNRWFRMKNELAIELLNKVKEEELHQIKTRFFTDISHELRTPLTLIIAPLENLISDLKENFRLRNQLMMIQRNGKKMLVLINQLLDLRKFETGHMELQAARGNISRFIRETTLSFRELAKVKGIQFNFTASKPVIEGWYDRNKLEIVLYNLLSNAFKATGTGGVIEVQVSVLLRDSEEFSDLNEKNDLPVITDEFVRIQVRDFGKGIPPELLNKIFDRFYQVDNRENGSALSSGVGLDLTKRMVRIHNGTITAESVEVKKDIPGRTVFTIILPLGKAHLYPGQVLEDFRTSEDRSLYQKELLNTEFLDDQSESTREDLDRILDTREDIPLMVVVEDNKEVCFFIRDLFKDKFKVHTAFDGKEGWDLVLKIIPDIIISDVMMPKLDGIELCRLIKTDKRLSHIPIILLTARTAVTFKYEGLETGADDYIQKPFSSEYLGIRVRNLLQQRRLMQDHFYRDSLINPEELAITSVDEKILSNAIRIIEENISDPELNVEKLSLEIGLSRVHFYRKIKFLTNLTAVEFIRSIRLKKAAQLLEQGKINVSEIRYMVGIQDAEYFRNTFKKQFGLTPRDYANQHTPSH
ncbi:MAG TPA: hybrid sensor histidine kinase/response regulator [Bacteroides sp.]|nr:hybrid sensor histidine kinase/response regulator [Bacteroides sp.]